MISGFYIPVSQLHFQILLFKGKNKEKNKNHKKVLMEQRIPQNDFPEETKTKIVC